LIEFLKGGEAVATSINVAPDPSRQQKQSGVIVMSFHEQACRDYSVAVYQDILEFVLRTGGVKLVPQTSLSDPEKNRLTMLCAQNRAEERCGTLGVRDPVSGLGGACFYDEIKGQ